MNSLLGSLPELFSRTQDTVASSHCLFGLNNSPKCKDRTALIILIRPVYLFSFHA